MKISYTTSTRDREAPEEIQKHFIGKTPDEMIAFAREGDEVYISDFTKLGDSTVKLSQRLSLLRQKKVRVHSLKENFDSATADGEKTEETIKRIVDFENTLKRKTRQGAGRQPKKLEHWDEVYRDWRHNKITAVEASRILGISRATFYTRVKAQKEKHQIKS